MNPWINKLYIMGIREKMTGLSREGIIGRLETQGLKPEIVKLLKEDDDAFQVLFKFVSHEPLAEALNSLYDYLKKCKE